MPLPIYNPKVAEEIFYDLSELWAPPKKQSVVEWVEENVKIPTGAITGRFNTGLMPYGREILERYSDKGCRHLVMVFPTQSGKSSLLTCGMLYKIGHDPEDALWVMGNSEQARDFNKERFMPFATLCGPVEKLIPRTVGGAYDKNLWGFKSQHFRSMVLNFVGAGSATNLSSRPRGFIQMDEVDKYYDDIKFDAGTIQLAEARMKSFPFPLSVKASTPTVASRMIWQEFKKTDQRKYWLPCPRCEKDILLEFTILSQKHGECGVRWWHEHDSEAKTDGEWDLKKVKANAFYRCQECGGMIHSFERKEMLEAGEWRADKPGAEEGRYGYHINSLYSILSPQTDLGNIAAKFLLAKGLRSDLQDFVNGWLAEPFDESRLYDQGQVTLEVVKPESIPQDAVTIMTVDCQVGHFWVVIRKWAKPSAGHPHGESWLLFAEKVDTADEIKELQDEYNIEGQNVMLDLARRPNQVGRLIIEYDWRGFWGSPTKKFLHPGPGGTKIQRPFSVVQFRDPHLGTKWESRTLQRTPYILFYKEYALDLVSALRHSKPTIWHATSNVSPRYSRHLNSRIKRWQQKATSANGKYEWIDLHRETHLFDCECAQVIRALQLGHISPPDESEAQYAE